MYPLDDPIVFLKLALVAGFLWVARVLLREASAPRVLSVTHLDPHYGTIRTLYRRRGRGGLFQDAFRETLRRSVPLDLDRGFLLFAFRDPWAVPRAARATTAPTSLVCISPHYAQAILGLQTAYGLWALSDTGIVFCLHMFLTAMSQTPPPARILVSGRDVTPALAPLAASVTLRYNLTADGLALLHHHLTAPTGAPTAAPATPEAPHPIRHSVVRILWEGSQEEICAAGDGILIGGTGTNT